MGIMKKLLKKILNLLPLSNLILFESRPDFSDNTKAVFDEMVRRGYNKKYRFVWLLSNETVDCSCIADIGNVSAIKRNNKSKLDKLKYLYVLLRAKLIIGCNDFVPKQLAKQKYIHLAHGCALKKTEYYRLPDYIDCVVTISDYMKKYDAINYNCPESKFIVTGYPRCDDLFVQTDIKALFTHPFDKIIIWLPTFRQSIRNGGCQHSSISFPIIDDVEKAERLNCYCRDNNTLIIVKIHPNQDMSLINTLELSNLLFVKDDFFLEKGITLYQFMGNCDALISDYSSVYYDYLLCDKPIGLCWEDFEDYNSRVGFTVNPQFILAGGEKLYHYDDLTQFISEVAENIDNLAAKRNVIKKTVYQDTDNCSTKRVVNIIDSLLKK